MMSKMDDFIVWILEWWMDTARRSLRMVRGQTPGQVVLRPTDRRRGVSRSAPHASLVFERMRARLPTARGGQTARIARPEQNVSRI